MEEEMTRMAIAVLGKVGLGVAGGTSARQNPNPTMTPSTAEIPAYAEVRLAASEQRQRMDRL
jgi:hypothetical protein